MDEKVQAAKSKKSESLISGPSVIASNYPPSEEQPCPTFSQTGRQLPLLNATLVSSPCVLSLRTDQFNVMTSLFWQKSLRAIIP